jgi:Txe/YoeB family toxin of Txe-Axe toxin-antitoxin module
MPIPVRNNTNYGNDIVTQKYTPLDINQMDLSDSQDEVVELFQHRIQALENQNIFPKRLTLRATDWDAIQQHEANDDSAPPIVVVSSNRSTWIRAAWNNAEEIQDDNYDDVNDVRALVAGFTPWYSPKRINDAHRQVYIVVHVLEYEKYRVSLADTGMIVIGWEFDRNVQGRYSATHRSYVGFGVSRYAAIEFCKHVFNVRFNDDDAETANIPLAANRQKAWLVDDNVAYVQSFPSFADAEAELGDGVWGLGFTGATRNSNAQTVRDLQSTNAARLGNDLTDTNYFLQQCVLWNIGQLNAEVLNFSPYFISSAEDTSLSSHLMNVNGGSKVRFARGATVIKSIVENAENGNGHDNDNTATTLAAIRNRNLFNYYIFEFNTAVEKPQNQNEGENTLADYITRYVLPNTPQADENPHITTSKAVEQIMAKTIKDHGVWVPDNIFQPNGNRAQTIRRL